MTHVAKMAKRCMRSARPCTVPRAESRQTRMRLSSLDTARLRGGGRGVSAGQLPWACGGWARAEQTAIHAARPSPPPRTKGTRRVPHPVLIGHAWRSKPRSARREAHGVGVPVLVPVVRARDVRARRARRHVPQHELEAPRRSAAHRHRLPTAHTEAARRVSPARAAARAAAQPARPSARCGAAQRARKVRGVGWGVGATLG